MDPYEALVLAIVRQAVRDYYAARERLDRFPTSLLAQARVESIERFFCSDWFTFITCANGEVILNRMKEDLDDGKGISQTGVQIRPED